MKEYIITVIGAAVLAAITRILSPESWNKYVRIITGLIIISVIIAPIANIAKFDLFSDFSIQEISDPDDDIMLNAVEKELKRRVEEDVSQRIRNEFFCDSEVEAKISVTENGEISGVHSIKVKTKADKTLLKRRIAEVYGEDTEVIIQ